MGCSAAFGEIAPEDNALGCWTTEAQGSYLGNSAASQGCFCTSKVGHQIDDDVYGKLTFEFEDCKVTLETPNP